MIQSSNELLQELYQQTESMVHLIEQIDDNMEQNEPEQLEKLELSISQRGLIIESMVKLSKNKATNWSPAQQEQIGQIQEWEMNMKPKLTQVHQSFARQINKLQQGKQATQHYSESYAVMNTDGSYIDKRK